MPEIIQIARTVNQATKSLTALDGLVTVTEWERSAHVYAFTTDGRTSAENRGSRLSITEFARLRINGLSNVETVRWYREAWRRAMAEHGCAEAVIGRKVTLPDAPWPGRQDEAGQKRYTEQDPNSFARHLNRQEGAKGDLFIDTFAQNLEPGVANAIVSRLVEDQPEVVARHTRPAIENEQRQSFRRLQAERAEPSEPRNVLGGRRPYMEAMAALHQIRSGTRLLGQLRDDLTDANRDEIVKDIDDALHFLGMVADVFRTRNRLDDELAAFLAAPEDDA